MPTELLPPRGLRADIQALRDLLIVQARGERLQYLTLARGKPPDGGAGLTALLAVLRCKAEQRDGLPRREQCLPCMETPDRANDVADANRLRQHACRACLQRLGKVHLVAATRQHQCLAVRADAM